MGRGYPKSGTRWPGRNGPDEMSRYEMVLARQLPESTGFWAEHPELLRTPSVTEFFCNEVQPVLTSGIVRPGPNVRFASLWVLFATGYQFTRHQI